MIPFFQSDGLWRNLGGIEDLLRSGRVGPGPRCVELAERIGPRCVLTTSGTRALSLAALALNVEIVIMPAYCVAAVPNAFRGVARLWLNDVSEFGAMLAERRGFIPSSERVTAVCYIDHGGSRDGLSVHRAWCDHEDWWLIEDASCAIGDAHPALGDAVVYSFSGPKLVTGGQGGAVIFKDQSAYEWASAYVDQGAGYRSPREGGLVRSPGTNLRMSDLTAALILAQLKRLNELRELQAEISAIYARAPRVLDLGLHKVCLTPRAAELKAHLDKCGIQASWPQYRAVYEHPLYAHLGDSERFPQAARWSREAVYLPFGPGLTLPQARAVVDEIGRFFDE